jgi:translation initiation factor IF-2
MGKSCMKVSTHPSSLSSCLKWPTFRSILGNLDTLRHIKKDIEEARKGSECGMSFTSFDNLREGDLIQFFEVIERPATL